MKLPKTFVPDKDLEDKTNSLLDAKEPSAEQVWEEKYGPLYAELKKEFPKFADYLIALYPSVELCKVKKMSTAFPPVSDKDIEWHFFVKSNNPTIKVRVGRLHSYTEDLGADTSEYGYKAELLVYDEKKHLTYRKGYHAFDGMGLIISTNDPKRVDKHTEVPFP
ncbi:hypothetical protein FJZ53_06390 [Candidatus Woesearchaeota archaeon]|nr:hypothetical protein [Candidatus Woesearchaeota archaeon]